MIHIPEAIRKAIPKSPMDNNYFYGADKLWSRLSKIRTGEIEYLNTDMSTLVNCIELYYKGFLIAQNIELSKKTQHTHNLNILIEEIEEKISPLQYIESQSDYKVRERFLKNFSNYYISTRYENVQVSEEDFQKYYDWVAKQRQLIIDKLMPRDLSHTEKEELHGRDDFE